MIKNPNSGFTTIELLIGITIVSVIGMIGVGGYVWYAPKAQVVEAETMIKREVLTLTTSENIRYCSSGGLPRSYEGKFGTLSVRAGVDLTNGSTCPSGCVLSYKFNTANTHKYVSGKVLAVDLLNSGLVSKHVDTTLPERLIPKGISVVDVLSGESCSSLAKTTPSITNGSVSGNETGESDPNLSPSGNNGGNGLPSGETTPVDPSVPDSSVKQEDELVGVTTSLIIDRYYMGNFLFLDSYHNKPSVNLYDFFVSKMGRAPSANEKAVITVDHDVAVLGKTNPSERFNMAPAGIVIDSRWGSKNTVQLINLGLVAGYGGRVINARCSYCRIELDFMNYGAAKDGGPAIQNLSTARVEIINKGIIAGGGGAGQSRHGERIRQYGQPGLPTLTGLLSYSHPDIMYETRCNAGRGATKPCILEYENWGDRGGVLGHDGYSYIGRRDLVGLAGHITVGNPVIFLERGDLRGR